MYKDLSEILKNATITTLSRTEMMEKMLARRDLFVKYFDVCILTSVEKQSGQKIASFVRQIKEASKSVLETHSHSLPLADMKPQKPSVDLYIKCEDEELSDKSNKVLSAMYNEFLARGIDIKIHALNGDNDKFVLAVKNMINNYQIQQIQQKAHER